MGVTKYRLPPEIDPLESNNTGLLIESYRLENSCGRLGSITDARKFGRLSTPQRGWPQFYTMGYEQSARDAGRLLSF